VLWEAVKAMLEPAMSRGSNALLVLGESCEQHALHGPHFPPLESQPTCGHGNRTPRQSHTMAVSLFSPRRSSRTQLPALEIWTLHRKLLLAVARSLTHPLSSHSSLACILRHSLATLTGVGVAALFARSRRNAMKGIPPELEEFKAEGVAQGWRALRIATALTTTTAVTM
jgi:hypothetical protein